jgi:hypothetical protein
MVAAGGPNCSGVPRSIPCDGCPHRRPVRRVGHACYHSRVADFICPNEAAKPAGGLRATTTQPPFWDGTGTDHNLAVTWDCTGGSDIITVLAEPDPNGVCTKN